jgi:hypothetical protein
MAIKEKIRFILMSIQCSGFLLIQGFAVKATRINKARTYFFPAWTQGPVNQESKVNEEQ